MTDMPDMPNMPDSDRSYRLSKPISRDASSEDIERIHKEEEDMNKKVKVSRSRDLSPEDRERLNKAKARIKRLPEPIPYEEGMPEGNYMARFSLQFQDMTSAQLNRIIAIVNILSKQVTGSSIGRSIYKLQDNDHSMRDHLIETYKNLDPNNPNDAKIIARAEEFDRKKKIYDRIPVDEYGYWFKKIWDDDFDGDKINEGYERDGYDYDYDDEV